MKTQWRDPKNVMGIDEIIPVAVAMFALSVPGPKKEFIARLTVKLIAIAMVYTVTYLANCFLILPDFARKVMFLFIMKFRDSPNIRDIIFEEEKLRKRKNKLKARSSRVAPMIPAKQNEKNFLFVPILINCEIVI